MIWVKQTTGRANGSIRSEILHLGASAGASTPKPYGQSLARARSLANGAATEEFKGDSIRISPVGDYLFLPLATTTEIDGRRRDHDIPLRLNISHRRRSASMSEAGGSPIPACSRPSRQARRYVVRRRDFGALVTRCANSLFHRHRLVSPAASERLNGYEREYPLKLTAPAVGWTRARSDGREIEQHAHVLIV